MPPFLQLPTAALRQALVSRWRPSAWMRYHGIWSPGVRLLRNQPVQVKAVLVGVLVFGLMGGMLAQLLVRGLDEWQRTRQALAGVAQVRALAQLELAALDAGLALMRGAGAPPRQSLDALFAREATAHAEAGAALAAATSGADAGLAAAAQEATRRRAEALALRQAGTGTPGPQVDAGPSAPHPGAAAQLRYAEALLRVRRLHEAPWALYVEDDGPSRQLRDGLLRPGAELGLRLAALTGALLQRAPQAGERLAEARALLVMTRPQIERARALLPTQAVALDGQWLVIERLLEVAGQVLRQPTAAVGPAPGGEPGLQPLGVAAVRAAARIDALGQDAIAQRLAEREQQLRQQLLARWLGLGAGMLFTLYVLVCLYKVLVGGLRFLCAQVDELGRGNLTIRPTGRGRDEIGRALDTLARAAARMSSMFEAVTQGVAAVTHASREVATGNAGLSGSADGIRQAVVDVAGRTERFAEAMDRCGAAMERVSGHVGTMRIDAQRSRNTMHELQQRMQALQGKSREISQVVTMVEAVAYQTKLLALNASVEAARAGDAGKGFAVVAQEVRTLANRSEAAARRIRAILDASIAEIEHGGQTADRAGSQVTRTDQEIAAVSAIVGEIVGMLGEGLSQSREVLAIARDVEGTVGGNARLLGQLTAASSELRDQGDSLKRSLQHVVIDAGPWREDACEH